MNEKTESPKKRKPRLTVGLDELLQDVDLEERIIDRAATILVEQCSQRFTARVDATVDSELRAQVTAVASASVQAVLEKGVRRTGGYGDPVGEAVNAEYERRMAELEAPDA
jgi:hypothetical protein